MFYIKVKIMLLRPFLSNKKEERKMQELIRIEDLKETFDLSFDGRCVNATIKGTNHEEVYFNDNMGSVHCSRGNECHD